MNCSEKEDILRKIYCHKREEELVLIAGLVFFVLMAFSFLSMASHNNSKKGLPSNFLYY